MTLVLGHRSVCEPNAVLHFKQGSLRAIKPSPQLPQGLAIVVSAVPQRGQRASTPGLI